MVQRVKFLIIRFSSIGDIVLTTPVVRHLKKYVEGAEVHFLTKKKFSEIVEHNPYIDKVHLYDRNFGQLVSELRDELFDYIIDLHHNLRTARLRTRLRVLTFSFDKLNLKKWLLVNFKVNKMPDVHIVDRYMETVKFFVSENDNEGLDYFIPKKDEVDLSVLPPEFQGDYVGLVIGAFHNTKKMPTDRLIELCEKIDQPVVILGGAGDKSEAEKIASRNKSKFFNACGQFNLNQSASLVRQAQLIITHDTGLMHIAAAFKKKIISLWGNTVPEFGMYPYLADKNSKIVQVEGLKCRPCSKIGFSRCPKKHFKCMNDINLEEIKEIMGYLYKVRQNP